MASDRIWRYTSMDRIRIIGGHCLEGTVAISGSKNAALPMMCACLLTDAEVRLANVPTSLSDVKVLAQLLGALGVNVYFPEAGTVHIRANKITSHTTAHELASKFRGSICILGPLLARCGRVQVHLPGGCAIGKRPVDFHIRGLQEMGALITQRDGCIFACADNGLRGAEIDFLGASVGATENLMMAACSADGTTTLSNASMDPDVVNLGELLIEMGVPIDGLGTRTITVHGTGKRKLKPAHTVHVRVIPDRIETGTWMIACCLTRGRLCLQKTRLDHLTAFVELLKKAGMSITEELGGFTVECRNQLLLPGCDISTAVYPGFPTDLQAPLMTLLTQCDGTSTITETVFENRFLQADELRKLGADIRVNGSRATITGVSMLNGASVSATDLRAGAALVLAALVANGETIIDGVAFLDRGYETIVEKLTACGADAERIY